MFMLNKLFESDHESIIKYIGLGSCIASSHNRHTNHTLFHL